MLGEALPFKVVRTKSHDEFRRRADECRRLAASARNARDRAFWLGLVERWQALESQSVPQPTLPSIARGEGQGARSPLRKAVRMSQQTISINALASNRPWQSIAPAAGGRAAGAGSRPTKRRQPF